MRIQITTGDRRRVEFVAVIIARLAAIALVVLALMLAAACRAPSQLLPLRCPEVGPSYCPAQHGDSVKKRGGR